MCVSKILDVEKQAAITRDNVALDVDAVVYWRILELELTYYAIENVEQAIEELVVTTPPCGLKSAKWSLKKPSPPVMS